MPSPAAFIPQVFSMGSEHLVGDLTRRRVCAPVSSVKPTTESDAVDHRCTTNLLAIL